MRATRHFHTETDVCSRKLGNRSLKQDTWPKAENGGEVGLATGGGAAHLRSAQPISARQASAPSNTRIRIKACQAEALRARLAERVGFEPTHPLRQDIESTGVCESGEASSSPLASLKSTPLSPELEKIVRAWATLRPELKAAIRAIVDSAR